MLLALCAVLAVMLVVMTAAWVTVLKTDNAGWTDVFWTFGTGASGVIAALSPWAGNRVPFPRAMGCTGAG